MPDEKWERLEAVFHAASAIPPARRQAYLDSACAGAPGLRRDLETLLASDTAAVPFEQSVEEVAAEWFDEHRASLAGRSLGPYRIDARIAMGGMADVYRAYDERLGRTVAIKVLAPYVTSGGSSRDQLQQEARAIATLSHPHICSLFDIGAEDGIDFLVMEYLEGETLAARLATGALGLDDALKVAADVAEALERAHRAGIVHLDLKPGNVMLTKDGAKLLDFGLARLHESAAAASEGVVGPLFGTLRYMAPEQLTGSSGDTRTDMWAFGCILFEMLAGRPAFEAETREALAAAIQDSDVDPITGLPPYVPEGITELLRACVARNPDRRWQSAGDFQRALRWARDRRRQNGRTRPDQQQGRRTLLPAIALALAAAWAAVLFIGWDRSRSPDAAAAGPTHLSLALPEDVTLDIPPAGSPLAISRDGRQVVFGGTSSGRRRLYVRALEKEDSTPLADTDDASGATFSPDGNSIAFVANGMLKRIAVQGGSPVAVGAAPPNATLNWQATDRILMGGDGAYIREIAIDGGIVTNLTALSIGASSHLYPARLSASGALLFTATPARAILLKQRDTLKTHRVVPDAVNAQVVGRTLIFGRAQTLWRAPFDPRTGAVTGEPRPIVKRLLTNGSGVPIYALSDNGTLLYVPAGLPPPRALALVDRSGRETTLALPLHAYRLPRLSPDGFRVVVSMEDGDQSLWLIDLRHPVLRRLTFENNPAFAPVWSPDGRRVYFSDTESILAIDTEGTNPRAESILVAAELYPTGMTPDGSMLLVHGAGVRAGTAGPGSHVGAIALTGTAGLLPLVVDPGNQRNAVVSPDGRWLAYQSDESGQIEVFVRSFPDGAAGKWQVSTGGGLQPLWSGDGRTLFYRNKAGAILAAPVRQSARFSIGAVAVAVNGPKGEDQMAPARSYDATPDGGRFLLVKSLAASAVTHLNVVFNWYTEPRDGDGRP